VVVNLYRYTKGRSYIESVVVVAVVVVVITAAAAADMGDDDKRPSPLDPRVRKG